MKLLNSSTSKVEFAPPVGYVEPERQEKREEKREEEVIYYLIHKQE